MLRDAANAQALRRQFTLSLIGTTIAFSAAGLVHSAHDRTQSLLPALSRTGSYEAYQGTLDASNFLSIALVLSYVAARSAGGVIPSASSLLLGPHALISSSSSPLWG